MLSISRSQKANSFQTVMGLFLLASGAAKRLIAVLAQAGLTVSYSTIMDHVDKLSAEAMDRLKALPLKQMCAIVWDNLNIPFRVEAQRLKSKNHFDNGTTGTLLPLWNPETRETVTELNTLPLDMKPPRTTTHPQFDISGEDVILSGEDGLELIKACIWYFKNIAVEHIPAFHRFRTNLPECPAVDLIDVHKTEQYPLPTLHIDESSIDGTIDVYNSFLDALGITDAVVEQHGIILTHGDLLTNSLISMVWRHHQSVHYLLTF
jgi:hypothetical protein